MAKIAYRLCLVLTAATLSAGVWLACREAAEPAPGTALTVHDPERDLGEVPGEPVAVTFRITNAGRAEGWVLNVADG